LSIQCWHLKLITKTNVMVSKSPATRRRVVPPSIAESFKETTGHRYVGEYSITCLSSPNTKSGSEINRRTPGASGGGGGSNDCGITAEEQLTVPISRRPQWRRFLPVLARWTDHVPGLAGCALSRGQKCSRAPPVRSADRQPLPQKRAHFSPPHGSKNGQNSARPVERAAAAVGGGAADNPSGAL